MDTAPPAEGPHENESHANVAVGGPSEAGDKDGTIDDTYCMGTILCAGCTYCCQRDHQVGEIMYEGHVFRTSHTEEASRRVDAGSHRLASMRTTLQNTQNFATSQTKPLRDGDIAKKGELFSYDLADIAAAEVAEADEWVAARELKFEEEAADPTTLITCQGPPGLQKRLRQEFSARKKVFRAAVAATPAQFSTPFTLEIDDQKWQRMTTRERVRNQAPDKMDEIAKQCRELEELGVIEKTQSSHFSQVVMAKKPDGRWRMCIDFRKLNECSPSLGWPIPRIKEILVRLGTVKAKYFGVIDLTAGYHQAELDPASRKYTAFKTHCGTYQWTRVAMGLKGAGSHFQQMMHEVLGNTGLLYTACELYIDDIIIYGRTEEEFADNVARVLQALEDHGITANPKKCRFGMTEVEYVGHVISADGSLQMSDSKKQKVVDFPEPQTPTQLRSFLGLVNFFRDHVGPTPRFDQLVRPLQAMVVACGKGKKLQWTAEGSRAFAATKSGIADLQTLWFPVDDQPVFLHTDACEYGVGAYCFQVIDGKERPVTFYSKSLSGPQLRWSTIDKECFAIVLALREFEYLLRHRHFLLRTDHANLTKMNISQSPRVVRWKMEMMEYDFDIEHIAGKANVVADSLSRLVPDESNRPGHAPAAADIVAALELTEREDRRTVERKLFQRLRLAEQLTGPSINTHTASYTWSSRSAAYGLALLTLPHGLESAQPTHDAIIRRLHIPSDKLKLSPEAFNKIAKYHNAVAGHHGVDRTVQALKDHHDEWVGMFRDVRKFIWQCPACQKSRVQVDAGALAPYTLSSTEGPMRSISVDTMGPFPEDEDGNKYLIVAICNFSRYVTLFPAKTAEGKEAARALLTLIGDKGHPDNIQSDGGSQYWNSMIKELSELTDMDHYKSAPYSHEENGIVERVNKTYLEHLRKLLYDRENGSIWSRVTPLIQRILNATVHTALGVSPARLMYGPALDLDRHIFHPIPDRPLTTLSQWQQEQLTAQALLITKVQQMLNSVDAANVKKRAAKQSGSPAYFPEGSYVLVKYHTRAPNKILLPMAGPYLVVRCINDHVTIKDIMSTNGRERDLHISRCAPFNFDPERLKPEAVARRDRGEFVIEKVLEYQDRSPAGAPRRKTPRKNDLWFKIRWLGYSADHDTWEPWSAVRDTIQLHRYLSAANLDSWIPKEFRRADYNVPFEDLDNDDNWE
jgi:hypothetical protein